MPEPTVQRADIKQVLERHEIMAIHYNPIPGDPRRSDGYWIAIAHCRCGHSSPPEHRAMHLAGVICEAINAE